MCGITGFIGEGDKALLERMVGTLIHRGPDESGYFVSRPVYLGMRRLSIIDVEGGTQPKTDESGKVQVFLNGEIYNFPEIKKDLAERHRFLTQSDTEVIAHLYEEAGEDVFLRLKGMFAIAIWDAKEKKLLLARDRLGEKPLFWTVAGRTFVFGSEIKSVLSHPAISRELNLEALWDYLTLEYIPSPKTIFEGIWQLEPGTLLVAKDGRIEIRRYWELQSRRDISKNVDELLLELDARLRRAVRGALLSDVPVGVFLSGGIDSSTVSYYAKSENAETQTFSIGFEDPSFDESRWANLMAQSLGTRHHSRVFRSGDLTQLIPELAKKMDQPLADPSLYPTHLLSRFAREHVKVALGGDGGDELFFGYPTFLAHRLAPAFEVIPRPLRKLFIDPLTRLLPASEKNWSFEYRVKRFVLGMEEPWPYFRDAYWIGAFTEKQKQELFLTAPDYSGTASVFERHLEAVKGEPFLNQISYLYLKTYLADTILVKTDRASMFASLEVRAPFLDHELIEFLFSLPPHLKLRGPTSKWILKRLMAERLPKNITRRKKKGFGIPVSKWLRKDLKNMLLAKLAPEKIEREGIFRPEPIQKLIREHLAKKADHRKTLWTLLQFELWREHWLGS